MSQQTSKFEPQNPAEASLWVSNFIQLVGEAGLNSSRPDIAAELDYLERLTTEVTKRSLAVLTSPSLKKYEEASREGGHPTNRVVGPRAPNLVVP